MPIAENTVLKKLFTFLLAVACCSLHAQPVPSTCTAADSVVKKYVTDAERLAVRRVYHLNHPFKDSARIFAPYKKMYLDALVAVFNATALPQRDTVISLLNVHSGPDPELRVVSIHGYPLYQWMQNLKNGVLPCGDANIDSMMSKYKLQLSGYYQSQGYDLVRFMADSSLNLLPVVKSFTAIQGVLSAQTEPSPVHTRDITDSINSQFTMLNYTYGWGSCADTCLYKRTWTFKIYNDCSVEFARSRGEPPFTAIGSLTKAAADIWPNPAHDLLNVSSPEGIVSVSIMDARGGTVYAAPVTGHRAAIDVTMLPPGLYLLRVIGARSSSVTRIIKD